MNGNSHVEKLEFRRIKVSFSLQGLDNQACPIFTYLLHLVILAQFRFYVKFKVFTADMMAIVQVVEYRRLGQA
jgi:hypothetical protein